jgi:hypothetical protein
MPTDASHAVKGGDDASKTFHDTVGYMWGNQSSMADFWVGPQLWFSPLDDVSHDGVVARRNEDLSCGLEFGDCGVLHREEYPRF